MKTTLTGVAAGIGALLLAPTMASASFENFGENSGTKHCHGGSVQTCASFQISNVWNSETNTSTILINVRNLYVLADVNGEQQQFGSFMTDFGILAPQLAGNVQQVAGTPKALDPAYESGAARETWTHEPVLNRLNPDGNIEGVYWGLTSHPQPLRGSLTSCLEGDGNTHGIYFSTCKDGTLGGWIQFGFTAQGQYNTDDFVLAWFTQGNSYDGRSYRGITTTTVPEPMTMLLLGSGLFGIGGVAIRRRRRDLDIENENTEI
jgi:hypothetical protein